MDSYCHAEAVVVPIEIARVWLVIVADPVFPRGVAPTPRWGDSLLYCNIFAENCMKMKQIELNGTHEDKILLNLTGIFR